MPTYKYTIEYLVLRIDTQDDPAVEPLNKILRVVKELTFILLCVNGCNNTDLPL